MTSICPSSTVVGSRSFTADARPAIAQPVPGTITFYNVKGQHNDLLLLAHTSFGTFAYLFLYYNTDFDNDGDGDPVLQADFDRGPGGSLFNLKTLDFKIHGGSARQPLLTSPPRCPKGGWTMGLFIAAYDGPPPIQALDSVSCGAVRPAPSVVM